MKVLELFSGTESFAKVAREYFGCETFTVDNVRTFNPDLVIDIENLTIEMIPFKPDIIWASPPCTTYSTASFPAGHRNAGIAVSEDAKKADRLVKKTIYFIETFDPDFAFIENPTALLRKMEFMQSLQRVTVTYCQYGTTNMKKTDIFGRIPNRFVPRMCKNGMLCHEEARRGAKTGTQGLAKIDRSRVPFKLCWELLNSIFRNL